jgi:hypothetical protein
MGKERMLAANTTHGRTTAPMRAEHHHARTLARRTRVVCAAKLLEAYLPPEMAARLAAGPEELWAPTHPSNLPFVKNCEPTLFRGGGRRAPPPPPRGRRIDR